MTSYEKVYIKNQKGDICFNSYSNRCIASYINKSYDESFRDLKERITSVDSELRDWLKLNTIEALEKEGYNVKELVINAYNLDSIYYT